MQIQDLEHSLLEGYRVLDLTQGVAGPYCTKLLANYGADIVKIEQPGIGDGSRNAEPFAGDTPGPERSLLFYYLNCDKRSITLDVSTPEGRAIFERLARSADLVVESFPTGTMDEWNLGFESLQRVNPSIVLTSLTPFGATGPYKDYLSSHIVQCGYGSWSHGVGEPDGAPVQTGGWIAHYIAGATASVATLAAMWNRESNGQGQHVDSAAIAAAADACGYTSVAYDYYRVLRARMTANTFPGAVPTSDGWIGLNALSYRNWQRLCQLMDREDLLDDHRFDNLRGRLANGPELRDITIPWAIERSKWDIMEEGQKLGASVGAVLTPADILEIEHHQARNYFHEAAHAEIGTVTAPGYPFRVMSDDGPEPPAWPLAPTLGQHTSEIFGDELGYSEDELRRLRESRVI